MFSVAAGRGKFVGTGPGGTLVSSNGVDWSSTLNDYGPASDVIHEGRSFFVLHPQGAINVSTNGNDWYPHPLLPGNPLTSSWSFISKHRERFVAASHAGELAYWTRDLGWQVALEPSTNTILSLIFARGSFFASQADGTILRSRTGETWERFLKMPPATLRRVGRGIYMLGGTNAWHLTVSGRVREVPSLAGAVDAVKAKGRYLAVGADGWTATSHDGQRWKKHSSGAHPWFLNDIAVGDGTSVAVGGGASSNAFFPVGQIIHTTNSTNWNLVLSDVANLNSVVFGNGLFIAGGESGACFRSPDGYQWSAFDCGATNSIRGIRFLNGRFVILGDFNPLLISDDGTNWSSHPVGGGFEWGGRAWQDIIHKDGLYVLIGQGIRISENLEDWVDPMPGHGGGLQSIAYANETFVAVTRDTRLSYYSSDGRTWRNAAIPSGQLFGLVALHGGFLAGGASGALLTSADGITWNLVPALATRNIHSLRRFNEEVYAVGADGAVLRTSARF